MIAYFNKTVWATSSTFGTYHLCEQRRFRRDCASAQSRQNLRCSLIQAVSEEEPSDRKPDPWPLWMAGHVQLKFVMTECSKTQICLTRPILCKWQNNMQACILWDCYLYFCQYLPQSLFSYSQRGILANGEAPDQTPQNVALDQEPCWKYTQTRLGKYKPKPRGWNSSL